ncbi:uncharacterized protein LOC118179752 [Stegodyphus dumicola]|uniref:uncharacterized protein LOC118179752 n=1 Tax=Stegodyphus dumicola TaxID=202533 RepID=UPI0015AFDB68|nr:uncharacterized protein LOC118179752 [Stegodyphus dumicola]XP_035204808.1 uncharacterized protein LOC118179752 [Stegodyphus dumicola]
MRVLPAVLQKDEVDVKKNDALRSLSEFPQENCSNFSLKEISESFLPSMMHNSDANQDKPKPESSVKNSKDMCAVSLEKDCEDSKKEYEKESLKEDKVKIRYRVYADIAHVFLAISLISLIRFLQIFILNYYQPSTTFGIFFKGFCFAYTFVVYFLSFHYLIVTSISLWQNIAYLKIADARIKELSV